jgi:serine/threonine protein kinase
MPSPTTIEEFLDLVRKSGVLEERRLDAHVEKLRGEGALPADPTQLAGVLVRDGLLTHFQAEQFLMGKWRRFTIGKYKVLERLGAGGMGSVYLCEHKIMRRRVAVKVLPTAKAEDASSLERFYREAKAIAALDHPNIVRAYDIDQDDKLHFLVMEHVDGSSLQDIVKKAGPMDVLRATHYIRQAALGLQHAHETAGLVHRDIKPGNILVDRNGIVKILDMGLARFFHDEDDILTKKYDENVLGTADYLAPEQALDSHGVDIRADIYSLGATFYFCLTGRTPFHEGTVAQKLIWHQTRQPKALRSLRPEVPEGIAAIIEKMMSKDPAARYPAPSDVAEALEPWTQTPIPPPPESEMPQFSLAARGPGTGAETGISSGPRTPSGGNPSSAQRKSWQVPPASSPRVGGNTPRPQGNAAAPRKSTPPPPTQPRKGPQPPPPRAEAGKGPAAPQPPAQRPGGNGRPNAVPPPLPRPAAGAALPEVLPVLDDEAPSWDKLSVDTDNPTVRGDTATGAGSRSPPSGRKRRSSTVLPVVHDRQFWIVVAAVTAVFLLVLACLLWWAFSPSNTHANGHPTEPASRQLVVDLTGSNNAYPNLQRALNEARPGDRILIKGDFEAVDVQVPVKNLTIEAAPGGGLFTCTWKCPAKANDPKKQKLLRVDQNGDGLRLKGLVLDGGNKLDTLVSIFGGCKAGVVLEDLILQNYQKQGVLLTDCQGGPTHPVVLSGLRFITGGSPAKVDVMLNCLPRGHEGFLRNSSITFRGCTSDGGPALKVRIPDEKFIDPETVKLPPEARRIGP